MVICPKHLTYLTAQLLDFLSWFGRVNLSMAKGLETVEHRGPSYIDFHTLVRSQGKIPVAFLGGAGNPDSFIEYMHSLLGKSIDDYSCFISYSSKDQAFAERLYADIQSKGVRCWFAPQDMRIGDEIRPRIDESIRVHDKLLLVLSESSLAGAGSKRKWKRLLKKKLNKTNWYSFLSD